MSIASELQNYADGLDDAYDAVNDMSGIVPQHKNMDNLDQAIRTIPQSSGPTPGDGVLTIQQNGTSLGTFSANQSTNTTVNITASSKTVFTWENGAMYDEDLNVVSGGDVYTALQSGDVEVINSMSSLIIENGIYAQWPDPTYGTLSDVLFFTTERTSYTGVMTRTQYLYDETNGWLVPNEMGIQEQLAAGSNITISNGTISATDTTYSDFTGATSSTAGTSGLAPAPAAGDDGKFLKGDGLWSLLASTDLNSLTTSYSSGDFTRVDIGHFHILWKDAVWSNTTVWTDVGYVANDIKDGTLLIARWNPGFGYSADGESRASSLNGSNGLIKAQIVSPNGNNGGTFLVIIYK